MSRRTIGRFLAPLAATALAVAGVSATTAAPAAAANIQAYSVCINTTNGGDFAGLEDTGTGVWNSSVSAVQLYNGGSGCQDIWYFEAQGGGSYAQVYSLGVADIVIDYQQAQQYYALRIVTHETGHALGLPDNYNGDCNILMSGGSAPTSCTNVYPSSGEAAQVNSMWGGFAPNHSTATRNSTPKTYVF